MAEMIGVDPHKPSHTAVAIDRDEVELHAIEVRATARQVGVHERPSAPDGGKTTVLADPLDLFVTKRSCIDSAPKQWLAR